MIIETWQCDMCKIAIEQPDLHNVHEWRKLVFQAPNLDMALGGSSPLLRIRFDAVLEEPLLCDGCVKVVLDFIRDFHKEAE